MPEPVRLVVWDLDETFWAGTLTEGGHSYSQANHDVVVELARRGIMSAICSKNDHAPVQAILQDAGIWDYFVFPTINWEPKGPRIAALIEAVQLRPETVMFVDDNPSNLNEALHFVPGLQVSDERIIPGMLANPLFRGKDDSGLTRLAQYKLLERRHADEVVAVQAAGGSNVAFLRASKIRVRFERDVESHLDRAVELINRTNQLNFTKRRLPEDPAEARAALLRELGHHMAQASLLEVSDSYGNYGYCGFYLAMAGAARSRLLHFCFSCRILNMGVEAWLYQTLNRPVLRVVGEVLSDPVGAEPVDWITAVVAGGHDASASAIAAHDGSVAARGGCVLMPLIHYFSASAPSVVGEYNTVRDGIGIRLDHSLCFRHAIEGLSPAEMQAAQSIGYLPADFQSRYFEHSGARPLWVFSNWADLGMPIYRHRATGLRLPFKKLPDGRNKSPALLRAEAVLAAEFDAGGTLEEAEMKENLRAVFSRVPPHGRMYVLLPLTEAMVDGAVRVLQPRVLQNRWTVEVAADFPAVELLDVADFIEKADDVKEDSAAGHFGRMVYFRLYEHIARANGMIAGTQASGSSET